MTPPQRILVRATNWVGDAVMSLPALQALRERYPKAHIGILARPWVLDLYAREPFANEVIPYTAQKGWHDLTGKIKLAADLRNRNFDTAILLQNAFEAAALVWLAKIPTRIGYNRDGRSLLLTHAIQVPNQPNTHQRFYYLELLHRAGILDKIPDSPAIRLTHSRPTPNHPLTGISPGAAYGTAKRWLPERFAEAAIQLGHEVAIFGSNDEAELCDQIAQQIQIAGIKATNHAGRTTLREYIDLAATCTIYLTNDSGGMHIASALGVPTVAIFGATDHEATGPTGDKALIVRQPVDCSPCLLRECPIDHRCMTRVTAAQVSQTAKTLESRQ